MFKKQIIYLLTLLILLPYSAANAYTGAIPAESSDQSCENLAKVYEDALNYFNTYKGEEKVKKTMLGTILSNDYGINLWNAQSVDLVKVSELKCNQLVYVYVESRMLADGKNAYADIVNKFEACMPKDYFKVDDGRKNTIASSHYISEKDKDAFLYYDWPEFEITLTNQSDVYTLKLSILSKKFK